MSSWNQIRDIMDEEIGGRKKPVTDNVAGTGVFVASGFSLYTSGPGNILLSYILTGAMQYCTMQSLCELCVLFPIAGSFSTFSTRFLDPSWGFAIGWK